MTILTYNKDDIAEQDLIKLYNFIDRYVDGEEVMLEAGRFTDWINASTQIRGDTDFYRAISTRPYKSLFKHFDDLTSFMKKQGFDGFPDKIDVSASIDMDYIRNLVSSIPDDPEDGVTVTATVNDDYDYDYAIDEDISLGEYDYEKSGHTDNEMKADEPKADEPKADEPKADEPKADEPKADEPKADAPKAGAPKADSPKADSPKADSPKADVPKADEPKADEPKADEPKDDSPKVNSNKTDPSSYSFSQNERSSKQSTEKAMEREKEMLSKMKFDPIISPAIALANIVKGAIRAPFESMSKSFDEQRVRRNAIEAASLSKKSNEIDRFCTSAKNQMNELNSRINSGIVKLASSPELSDVKKETLKSEITGQVKELKSLHAIAADNYLKNTHVGKSARAALAHECKGAEQISNNINNMKSTNSDINDLHSRINEMLSEMIAALTKIFKKKDNELDSSM